MITLAADCLVFQLANGENIPFSPDMVTVELMGEAARRFDSEFVMDAAKAVFHYFKHEQQRETVSVGEFAEAMERALGGFERLEPSSAPAIEESDLRRLAQESGLGCELFFFARLRDEMRQQVQRSRDVVRFIGLRGCVKELVGARRWGDRCRTLEQQILGYLSECLSAESRAGRRSLVVK